MSETLEIICENCGSDLDTVMRGNSISVYLCRYCLDEAKKDANEAGYNRGYADGEENVAAK